jgi:uncharacterized membrane protein
MKTNRWTRPLTIIVAILAFIGVNAAIAHYFIPSINPGYQIYPLITALHVIPAGIWMLLAPFQFIKRIRAKWLNYHRWAGRVLVPVALVFGASALFLALVIPVAGWPERVILSGFGLFFLIAIGRAFFFIRSHQVNLHREWMIRAFALSLAVSTVRLIEIPALVAIGHADATVINLANLLAFTLHAVVAELWIRGTRHKHSLATRNIQEKISIAG